MTEDDKDFWRNVVIPPAYASEESLLDFTFFQMAARKHSKMNNFQLPCSCPDRKLRKIHNHTSEDCMKRSMKQAKDAVCKWGPSK